MSRLPRITGKVLVATLERLGFKVIRVKGSHHHLHKLGSNLVTVPVHSGEILSPIVIKSVLKQAGLDVDELTYLYYTKNAPKMRRFQCFFRSFAV